MIRKLLSLTLACGVAAGAVAGCGGDGGSDGAPSSPSGTGTSATAPTPEETASSPPGVTAAFSAKVSAVPEDRVSHSWREGCPVPLSDLRLITMTYLGFDDEPHTGEMVVHREVADDVVAIFEKLYDWRFPIRRMELVDKYKGSDFDSIEADNTSAFNCRRATGSRNWSQHSYGRAIDLNPRENPYVEEDGSYAHENAKGYTTRPVAKPGVINPGDRVVRLFAQYGWEWGGYWSGAKDYQHFSKGGG